MKFYKIRSQQGAKFAWASGYGPLASMPYLNELNELNRSSMIEFWRVNPSLPGLQIDPGGSEWPDCISVSLGWPYQCFSERVVSDMKAVGIEVWRVTEMPIAEIKSKRLQKKKVPRYFVLEAENGFDVDYKASGIPLGHDGQPLHNQRDKNMKGHLTIKLSSWSGKHLVSCNGYAPMLFFCSEVVKQLSEEKGWTNFLFEEVPVV